MTIPDICPMSDRRYEKIPIDQIKVINSRLREEHQFQMNVQSIEQTGMQMPIRVNDKFLSKSGVYELICGEGRLIGHRQLGRNEIESEIVTCTRKDAYLQSLVENIARTKPGTMDFARELKRMKDAGWDYDQIARVCCKSAEYVRQYIRLVEQGEERLIIGVEQGLISISFAVLVASSDDGSVQNVLMDAFDQGIVNAGNFARVRRIINGRLTRHRGNGHQDAQKPLTVLTLKKDISATTRAKDSFVREAKAKENRFLSLLLGVDTIWRDDELKSILSDENLMDRPQLAGAYRYESQNPEKENRHHAD